jgi:hypothetical protein
MILIIRWEPSVVEIISALTELRSHAFHVLKNTSK